MHVDRLERMERCLRAYVENAARYRFEFNLGLWSARYELRDALGREECCYTSGCAIGLALHQKIFEKEGLRNLSTGPVLVDDDGKAILFHGFEAIEILFDLKPGQARHLFTIQSVIRSYDDRHAYGLEAALACADRIRGLIGEKPVEVVKSTKVLESV